jgi:Na+-transporting NADH:ubiquinone oxidoreductase subunit NqrB
MRDVSWKRVALAAAATVLSLYALQFARTDIVYSELAGSSALFWLFALTLLSNAVWWGILLFPGRAKPSALTVTARK